MSQEEAQSKCKSLTIRCKCIPADTPQNRLEKCDSALPRCTPCQTTNSECHQADVRRQTSYPRGYVEDLEARCQAAERRLAGVSVRAYLVADSDQL